MAGLAQGYHRVAAALLDVVGIRGWMSATDAAGQLFNLTDPLSFFLCQFIVHGLPNRGGSYGLYAFISLSSISSPLLNDARV